MRDTFFTKTRMRIACLCLSGLVFASCSYKQNQLLFANKATAETATTGIAQVQLYKIQPQDVLQVRNLQSIKYIVDDIGNNSATSSSSAGSQGQSYIVEDDGTVALPAIGRVEVAGLTRYEATRKIEALYRKTIKDPIIEVKLTNLTVTVMGEVRSPGNYPLLKDRVTLVEMLGLAGGVTDKADETQVKIIRGGINNQQEYVVDLGDVRTLRNPVTVLQNQDIIYVAQNRRAIRNDKLTNISTIMQPALLLMNTALIIYTLTRH